MEDDVLKMLPLDLSLGSEWRCRHGKQTEWQRSWGRCWSNGCPGICFKDCHFNSHFSQAASHRLSWCETVQVPFLCVLARCRERGAATSRRWVAHVHSRVLVTWDEGRLFLPSGGFITVSDILSLRQGRQYREEDVRRVVENCPKQRFALRENSPSGQLQIRANQGHSIQVYFCGCMDPSAAFSLDCDRNFRLSLWISYLHLMLMKATIESMVTLYWIGSLASHTLHRERKGLVTLQPMNCHHSRNLAQVLPSFLSLPVRYCKRWKAGRGLGTRLAETCYDQWDLGFTPVVMK